MIHASRIQHLRSGPPRRKARYVLYWMQAAQRTRTNHALEHAIRRANTLDLPAVVCFGLTDDYPEANERHYAFMLEGLRDVETDLRQRGVKFVLKRGDPPDVALDLARRAALVVCDRGYTRHQKRWREKVADDSTCPVDQVETDVVVPVEVASDRAEYAARTIRPKISKRLTEFLRPLRATKPKRPSVNLRIPSDIDVSEPEAALAQLRIDRSVQRSGCFIGGQVEAQRRLRRFVAQKLNHYAANRNEPSAGHTSTLSPYLHFGQISPLEIGLRVRRSAVGTRADRQAFLEELIVRRELAANFVNYTARYDKYDALPDWARRTLGRHSRDRRAVRYRLEEFESAATHDPFWNAAQREMVLTGFMPNYMRMYWGKKIIEWSPSPRQAFNTALRLNNKYFIDGRDPSSFANVAWLFGLHDRPWGPERKIFGTVRYMNAAGLSRKFDMDAYVCRVAELER